MAQENQNTSVTSAQHERIIQFRGVLARHSGRVSAAYLQADTASFRQLYGEHIQRRCPLLRDKHLLLSVEESGDVLGED
jgi:hypothetical protein